MSVESAKQDIKGSYGEGFVIMGADRVEVSPDGKKVTAYTNDGVELKDAVASGAATQGISISADFNTVVLKGITIERAADGHLVFSAPGGTVLYKQPGPGSVRDAGEHKGEIYGGIWSKEYGGENKPIWFSQLAPKLMNHYNAA